MAKEVGLLIKFFDNEEYADKFIRTGEMYCQTMGFFRRIEGDAARGDKYEGASGWYQPDGLSVAITCRTSEGEEKSIELEGLAGPLVMQRTNIDNLNGYCMYAVTIPEFSEPYETDIELRLAIKKVNAVLEKCVTLDEEMSSFGEHAVVIYRVSDFLERVFKAAEKDGYNSWRGLVDYFDPNTFHGEFNGVEAFFKKRNVYAYQKEFRFIFESEKPQGAKTLRIGPLDGIARKLPAKKINECLKLEVAGVKPRPIE